MSSAATGANATTPMVELAVRADAGSIVSEFGSADEALSGRGWAALTRDEAGAGAYGPGSPVEDSVSETITDVLTSGDAALRRLAHRYDGVELGDIEVPPDQCARALEELDPPVHAALERARRNIDAFHEATRPQPVTVETEPGVVLSQEWGPLAKVGVYAPGGRAAYPSSVLMGVVPARVAGVEEVAVCSPPGPNGHPSGEVMAACALAGADRLFALGGAGAIAAMAYGTETVAAVDAIVGPGNAWVTEAKRQVQGRVRIDSLAGPSEALVIADEGADPFLAALELVAQAEHDPEAACVLVTTSRDLAGAVERELASIVERVSRRDIVTAALAARGGLVLAESADEALAFADWYAPEHMVVMAERADELIAAARPAAGTVFLGPHASVAFGDYLTGANHVLPTGRRAEVESGLGTRDFMRSWTVQRVSRAAAARLASDTAALAEAEGLPGHAEAARARLYDRGPTDHGEPA